MNSAVFLMSIFISIFNSLPSSAAGCLRTHLREAVAINQTRMPIYDRLSGGASRSISEGLIAMEKSMLFVSYFAANYDRWSEPFDKVGIPVVCEAYVSMSETPMLSPEFGPSAPPSLRKADLARNRGVKERMWAAYESKNAALVAAVGRDIVFELAAEKKVNCLTRHFVESAARIAALVPDQARRAYAAGISSPEWLSWKMIHGHLLLLDQAFDLDEAALPLQQKGIPILCQDVPHIPIPF